MKIKKDFPLKFKLLIYYIVSIFYMETLLRIATIGSLFSPGLFFTLIFGISFSIIIYTISNLFENTTKYVLSLSFLLILTIVFSSQLVYFKIFKTFYTIYSAGNAGQILEFWKEAIDGIKSNILYIVLIFIPLTLFLFKGKKIIFPKRVKKKEIFILLVSIIIFHAIGLAGIYTSGKDINSPYSMYFNMNYPDFSVDNLGLITYMRLDIKRQIIGWTPKLEDEVPVDYTDQIPYDHKDSDNIEKPVEYNIMDIDFHKLMDNENSEDIKMIHKYFKNINPTEKNQYTGKYKDYNLILITAEGFSHLAIDKDITPTLYKMVHEGYNFTNFYTPLWGVSTSDGEYVANTSLIPKSGVWSFKQSSKNYMPFSMGNQLKSLGYTTKAYHNHTYTFYGRDLSHPNMGYDYKGLGNGLNVKATWPESDVEMMELTIPEYIKNQPFHAYYMTVSGHMLYTFEGNYIAHKNRDLVKNLKYSENVKAYLATQIELDKALEYLLDELDRSGIANRTLIALSADHYPYGLEVEEMEELANKTIDTNFELYKNAFILYTKDMEPEVIDKPASSLDIIPTISNLMGLEYDSRLLMGRDIFANEEPLVIFANRSFITDKGRYNTQTKTYTPNKGFKNDEEYIQRISNIVNNKFFYSTKILDTDYYSKVFK